MRSAAIRSEHGRQDRRGDTARPAGDGSPAHAGSPGRGRRSGRPAGGSSRAAGRDVGRRRVSEVHRVGQGGQPGGQPLERAAVARPGRGRSDPRGERGAAPVAGGGDDHDRRGDRVRRAGRPAGAAVSAPNGSQALGRPIRRLSPAAEDHRARRLMSRPFRRRGSRARSSSVRVSGSTSSARNAATAGRSQRARGWRNRSAPTRSGRNASPYSRGHRLDRHAPVGPPLRDRRGDRVVRPRLDREARAAFGRRAGRRSARGCRCRGCG